MVPRITRDTLRPELPKLLNGQLSQRCFREAGNVPNVFHVVRHRDSDDVYPLLRRCNGTVRSSISERKKTAKELPKL